MTDTVPGTCKHCGAEIRWIKTARGKWMPLQNDDHEPHFPHCGKNLWTQQDWDDYHEHIRRRTIELNTRTKQNNYLTTNPQKRKCFYSGTRPPWEYPTLITCIERKGL